MLSIFRYCSLKLTKCTNHVLAGKNLNIPEIYFVGRFWCNPIFQHCRRKPIKRDLLPKASTNRLSGDNLTSPSHHHVHTKKQKKIQAHQNKFFLKIQELQKLSDRKQRNKCKTHYLVPKASILNIMFKETNKQTNKQTNIVV